MGEEYIRRIMVLGSVPSLGPVMLFDDMEDLLKWSEIGTGGDTVFEKSTTTAYNGSASLHLKARTTGATDGDNVGGERHLFQRPGKRYRVELLWRFEVLANTKYFSVVVEVLDGSSSHFVELRWDRANTKWLYTNSAGVLSDVPGGTQSLAAGVWHRLVLEFDENKSEFVRMVSDNLEVDMSGISYYGVASSAPQQLWVEVYFYTAGTTPVEGYVDDVLLMEI